MEYHLHRDGQNVGIFSLDELRRRRAAGELSGEDLVWREGMANWAPLDAVLQESSPGGRASAQPPPIPASALKPGSNRLFVGLLVGAGVVVFLAIAGLTAVKFVQGFRRGLQAAHGMAPANAVDAASKPVSVTTNSLTEQAVRKRNREFRVRQYVEGYRKNGQHTATWDSDAAQLLDAWIASNYGGATNLPSPRILSDKLAALPGCDDPLVLTAAAANTADVHEKMRRLERALAGFDQSRHLAYPKFYAAAVLATELGKQSQRIPSLDQRAMQYFKHAFTDGSFQPGDEEEVADILVDGWGSSFFKRNGAAVYQAAQQAKGYPWLALVLEGEDHIAEAWKARGGGWADSVKPEGWQGFAEHLAKARTAFTKAWELHRGRPLAPSRMIQVAMGETGADEMRTWFDRTVEAQIDYPQAWSQFRWGLRPRWNGSHEAMLALGVSAVDTKRFDTDVPRKFFDCISDVESELELQPGEHIYGRPDIWPHLKEMYEGYLAEPSQAGTQHGWRSTYAAVAYLAGDYQLARKQLEALNWKPFRESLTGWGTDLSLMPLKVAALTGKSAAQVEGAESSYSGQDLATSVKLYTELGSAPESDEGTREFSHCRLAALKQEQLLAKGEWIELLPADDKDPNWELEGNKVRRLPDGALEIESGPHGHSIYCRTRVGPEFEVSGEFELVRSSTRDFQAGLLMGLPDSQNSPWYAFRMKRNAIEGDVASFSHRWSREAVSRKAALNEGRNSFRFHLQGSKADAWVNEAQVLRQAAPSKTLYLYPNSLLGLGAYSDMNDTVIRYRNVKVRRLLPGR